MTVVAEAAEVAGRTGIMGTGRVAGGTTLEMEDPEERSGWTTESGDAEADAVKARKKNADGASMFRELTWGLK